MLERLASFCFHRRRYVLLAWIFALPLAFGLATAAGGTFSTQQGGKLPNSDSQKAFELIDRVFPAAKGALSGANGQVVFFAESGLANNKAEIDKFLAKLRTKTNIVKSAISPFESVQPRISRDGKTAVVDVEFVEGIDFQKDPQTLPALARDIRKAGVVTEFGGQAFYKFEFPPSEIFGLIAAVLILLLAFGSLIAMGLPILTALFGVGIAIALVQLVAAFISMPNFVTQLSAMIGLGVGIDYVLFIITRYREELSHELTPHDATVRALGTSGKAVVFAGITVLISMLGMLLMNLDFVRGIAIAGAMPVLIIVLASITLIPAMLGFIGHHINSKRQRAKLADTKRVHKETGWHRWSRLVQRKAPLFAIAGFALLIALTIPVKDLRLGFSDRGNDPAESTTRKAYDLSAKGFGAGSNGPLIIAVDAEKATGDAGANITELATKIGFTPDVAFVLPPDLRSLAKKVVVLTVIPKSGPQDEATDALVKNLRKTVIPDAIAGTGLQAYVGGWTAGGIDFSSTIATRLPLFIGAVLILSFLLLMAVFRSILVPLKAVIMNLLSIGASYGVVTWIFQNGHLGSLIGLGKAGPIEPWAPMMLFAIVFGLSMDYEVFLLSKIKEEYDIRKDNSVAVVEGLASTARLITAAAAIMVCVFLGFVMGDRTLKLFGIGLATAVFLDATVVRIILVPATMQLLGNRNWWMPKWLDKLLPTLDVEGHSAHAAAVQAATSSAASSKAVTR